MGCLLGWVGSGLFARNFKLVNVELLMDPNTDWAQILIRTFCGGVWREGGGGELAAKAVQEVSTGHALC